MKAFFTSFLVLVLFLPSCLRADRLLMENGDVLTGEVLSKSTDTLIFKTDYSPEMQIEWSAVRDISTEDKFIVIDTDGQVREVKSIRTKKTENKTAISKTLVHEINPENWKIGKGHQFTV